ncbi:MAG: phage tail protein [Candidatus Rokuibacteriota bacterium]
MAEPFLAEIKIVSFNFPPKGWALCNGQLLPINQNQALFSLLGTTYGGDGRVTFALPNLQGRVPVHFGEGLIQGQADGEESHTLTQVEMPQHSHLWQATSAGGTTAIPGNDRLLGGFNNGYNAGASPVSPPLVGTAGGSQPHNNMQPYLVLTVVIALQGVFPSRN